MAGPVGVAALNNAQMKKRFERLTDFLDAWGDLRASDVGGARGRRLLEFGLEAPGEALPVQVKCRYREYYRLGSRGWDIRKYTYEYLDVARARRLAYHLHALGARNLVVHAHCESAIDLGDEETSYHLRATELDLREAHEEFMSLWASDVPPDCARFRPLEVARGT